MSRSRSSTPNCQMSLFSELEMSCSDQEKSLRATALDVIDETDEEFDIEERDDSDYEMICGVDKDLENFKKEVSHNDKQIMSCWLNNPRMGVTHIYSLACTLHNIIVSILSIILSQVLSACQQLRDLSQLLRQRENKTKQSLECLVRTSITAPSVEVNMLKVI